MLINYMSKMRTINNNNNNNNIYNNFQIFKGEIRKYVFV